MFGGEGGIRTHGGLAPTPVFKTGAFNRSATSPYKDNQVDYVCDQDLADHHIQVKS